ncbi:ShlB/FhaC/HecB family hemolysin secretion/activation protein [Ramlibacter sp.]|uniref:ShlB/FhaC/HecB family hemolysin secretion/activation protein n=1 Tax=Ramlibacter sp. TaxID=1917967 RepID=UPI003D09E3B9
MQLVPAAFRFTGNTVFTAEALQAVVARRVGHATDLSGLQEAARDVREYYQDRGYLLTDAFIPEQALAREGGTVTIEIVEARVGRVEVKSEGSTAPAPRVFSAVRRALPPGSHATDHALDLPVLLVRDLSGHDATAVIQPGARTGEVDLVVTVRAQPRDYEASLAIDNHGVRSAGRWRATAGVDASNVSGRGDSLSARVQVAQITESRLYRLAYTVPVADAGTRATLALARSEYALGGAFEALGAHGTANVAAASLLHPLVRGRTASHWALASFEHKQLEDRLAAGPDASRRIGLVRVGIAGNALREGAASQPGSGALTSYAASVAWGRLGLDGASSLIDAGAGGLRTQGRFSKFNGELQRTQFLSPRWSIVSSLQAQYAFDNLASAEKMTLGGPVGVRAFASGEGVGDHGVLGSAELRYQLAAASPLPVGVGVFYDAGRVRASRDPVQASGNQRTLAGAGFSLLLGGAGRFVAAASVAWQTSAGRTAAGDRSRAFWLTAQTRY